MQTTSYVFLLLLLAINANAFVDLSQPEIDEIDNRLMRFYKTPHNQATMNEYVPKYSINEGRWKTGAFHYPTYSPQLVGKGLKRLGGFKNSKKFQAFICDRFYKLHFPDLYTIHCTQNVNASIAPRDRIERLTYSWIATAELEKNLDGIQTSAETALPLWSDDYWRTRWGITSYRYSSKKPFATYREAINAYHQPDEWLKLFAPPILPDPSLTILSWSPSEKYDVTVGDERFSLTMQQKAEGESELGVDGNIEEWMGICHGWTAATIMLPAPMKATKVEGAKKIAVEWYPADIRALATLAWANGTYDANYLGGRCSSKNPEVFPNGRLRQQECFDVNPAGFHLALANMIGKHKHSFVMDETFDYEVWNQPVHSYRFAYFNPLDPTKKSDHWNDVAVAYDNTFRARDRFQNPLTRGKKNNNGIYDDSAIQKIVGVIVTVAYLTELSPPSHSPNPDANAMERVSYSYDLEVQEIRGAWIPTGGEWHQNQHPDFLWIPQKDAFAGSSFDSQITSYEGVASEKLAAVAMDASKQGTPLCRVLKEIFKRSTGSDEYWCE